MAASCWNCSPWALATTLRTTLRTAPAPLPAGPSPTPITWPSARPETPSGRLGASTGSLSTAPRTTTRPTRNSWAAQAISTATISSTSSPCARPPVGSLPENSTTTLFPTPPTRKLFPSWRRSTASPAGTYAPCCGPCSYLITSSRKASGTTRSKAPPSWWLVRPGWPAVTKRPNLTSPTWPVTPISWAKRF